MTNPTNRKKRSQPSPRLLIAMAMLKHCVFPKDKAAPTTLWRSVLPETRQHWFKGADEVMLYLAEHGVLIEPDVGDPLEDIRAQIYMAVLGGMSEADFRSWADECQPVRK